MIVNVTTYSTIAGRKVNLTGSQIKALEAAGEWPRTDKGDEYCQVSHDVHRGTAAAEGSVRVGEILAAAK